MCSVLLVVCIMGVQCVIGGVYNGCVVCYWWCV